MYNELEKNYQAKIEEGLNAPKPDVAALLSNAQAMLAKFDQGITMVEKGAPLNPLVRRRCPAADRTCSPAEHQPRMKEGNIRKAQTPFAAFRANWPCDQ